MTETLSSYISKTQLLLQNPPAPSTLYDPANLTTFINTSRGQIAGEGECVRVNGTIATVADQRNYNFTSIGVGAGTVSGIQGPIHVRSIFYGVGSGQQWIAPRPWEWFQLYGLNNPVPQSAAPQMWSQYGQGVSGSFYLDPPPDVVYTLNCDCVCYPISLSSDSDTEAIPYLWTDAVPYLAAYYALLAAQAGQRSADANRMFERFEEFMARARKFSNPSVGRWQYAQAGDPAQAAKMGLAPKAGAA